MSGAEPKSKRPKDTAFRQQNLKAWRPILTPRLVIGLFLLVGVVFIPIGAAVIVASESVVEVESVDYSGFCCEGPNCASTGPRQDRNPCFVDITVKETMAPPIYVYYKLTNYYQNHRRYVKSRSDQQLRDDISVPTEDNDDTQTTLDDACEERLIAVLPKTNPNASLSVFSQLFINPCGLIAFSYFNDTFSLLKEGGTPVPIVETDIAWKSDVDTKFKNDEDLGSTGQNFDPFAFERNTACDDGVWSSAAETTQMRLACNAAVAANPNMKAAGLCFRGSKKCVEDEHFIVWMRTAGLPTFRKLFGRIDTTLEPGTYSFKVSNGVPYNTTNGTEAFYNPSLYSAPEGFTSDPSSVTPPDAAVQKFLYPVHPFDGTKTIVLSTASWIGGRNAFLGWSYLVVGIVCVVLAVAFAVKKHFFPRKLGSAPYVPSDK